jgi:DNA-binding transcriptional LysR family regulator
MVSVTLTISDSRDIEARILRGELELGVVGYKSSESSLISHELWEDELILAVPADHAWAKKGEISAEKLFSQPFILREEGSGTLGIMQSYLRQAKYKGTEDLQVVTRVGSSTAVKEAIKAGLGISILSSRAVQTEVETGLLRALTVKGMTMKRSFYLIRDKRRIASPLCKAMMDFLIQASRVP